jgi:hypothetical protein
LDFNKMTTETSQLQAHGHHVKVRPFQLDEDEPIAESEVA